MEAKNIHSKLLSEMAQDFSKAKEQQKNNWIESHYNETNKEYLASQESYDNKIDALLAGARAIDAVENWACDMEHILDKHFIEFPTIRIKVI